MNPSVFLHLTDAEDDTPVRIRMDLIESIYVYLPKEDRFSHHGSVVATAVGTPYTMISYGNGQAHGVRESIGDIESQMADAYELAGIASLD